MDQGLTLLVIGAVLVYGARFFSKIIRWVSLLALKSIGLLIAIVGILFVFDII